MDATVENAIAYATRIDRTDCLSGPDDTWRIRQIRNHKIFEAHPFSLTLIVKNIHGSQKDFEVVLRVF